MSTRGTIFPREEKTTFTEHPCRATTGLSAMARGSVNPLRSKVSEVRLIPLVTPDATLFRAHHEDPSSTAQIL